jgi:GAF domain-containing protein
VSNADFQEELGRAMRERDDALHQQTATAEILKMISSSPTDTQPVFEAIVQSGLKLFPDAAVLIVLPDGDKLRAAAFADTDPARAKRLLRAWPVPLTREYNHAIAILDRRMIDIPDARDAPSELASGAQYFLTTGYRAITIMPMMRGGEAIGALSVVRATPGKLSKRQVAALRTYADQAVIAIENTRLLNELRESLQQQTATSDVLRVISTSPTNVQPVFDAIAESAVRLCDGQFSFVMRFDGRMMFFASCSGLTAEGLKAFQSILPMPAREDTAAGRATVRRAVVEIPDVEADPSYGAVGQGLAKAVTYRSIAAVPLLQEGNPIGAIAVARANAGSFPRRQIALLQAFADQAVIAIENVRLFDEVQARTAELSESLQQQTATADVLKVISRSAFNLQTVLDTLVESAVRLCEADSGILRTREGDIYPVAATCRLAEHQRDRFTRYSAQPDRGSLFGRAILEGRTIHVSDVLADPEYDRLRLRDLITVRAGLAVPMMRDGTVVGVVTLQRKEPRPFSDSQIQLVTTFADQAVIAIENVRLFEAEQQRAHELRESLQQQTATADVLKVISRSTFDLKTVLTTLVETAVRVCEADIAISPGRSTVTHIRSKQVTANRPHCTRS